MLDDLTKAITLAKEAHKFFTDAEAKLAHAELISTLADVKMEVAELQEALLEKQREVDALREQLTLRDQMEHDGKRYWRVREDGTKDGPFCARCFDADGKMIRMRSYTRDRGVVGYACDHCPVATQRGTA